MLLQGFWVDFLFFWKFRYFGKGGASPEEKADFERLIAAMTKVDFAAIISDFIPNLTFLTKLQGYNRIFKGIRDDAVRIGGKMLEVEKHRERAKERQGSNVDQDQYVPDFVDMLSEEPLDDGKPLPNEQLTLVVLVRTDPTLFSLFSGPNHSHLTRKNNQPKNQPRQIELTTEPNSASHFVTTHPLM